MKQPILVDGTPVGIAEVDASHLTDCRVLVAFQGAADGDSWRGLPMAVLTWDRWTGVLEMIATAPDVRRLGLASALWGRAKAIEPGLQHSPERSPSGTKWAKAVGGPVPKVTRRYSDRDVQHTAARLMHSLFGFGPDDVVGEMVTAQREEAPWSHAS